MTTEPSPEVRSEVAPEVRSEVGALRTVVLHRPGEELRRVTPATMGELLFDELLWVEEAQREHDAFAGVLRDAGVEVLLIADLLADVLVDRALAAEVVARHVTPATCGPQLVDRVRALVLDDDPAALARHLIAGVTFEEVVAADGAALAGLVAASTATDEAVLSPLPNLVFTRDASAWIGGGVVLSPMRYPVRQRETDLLRTLVGHHPRFAGAPVWFGDGPHDRHPATVEGGDLLVVGERAVAIGISERTSAAGAEQLATRLFAAGAVDRILIVELPEVRAAMHLDTVVTQVDVDAFLTYPQMTASVRCFQLTSDRAGHLRVADAAGLLAGLAWASGRDHVRSIAPDLGSARAAREQWNDANNTLALRPGEVIAYARNEATNEVLDAAGITVRTIPSAELPRGRGGPRCMSCPVVRDPVPG